MFVENFNTLGLHDDSGGIVDRASVGKVWHWEDMLPGDLDVTTLESHVSVCITVTKTGGHWDHLRTNSVTTPTRMFQELSSKETNGTLLL